MLEEQAAVELAEQMPAAEAGRLMMAQQLAHMLQQETAVRETADPLAVHELRKAIRRTFTAYRLFDPYFLPGTLRPYRRRLRRLMRRLGRSRDLTVFRRDLIAYNGVADRPLPGLEAYWAAQQSAADGVLRDYLGRDKWQMFLAAYGTFCATPGAGASGPAPQIAYVAPVLIYQRLAGVRAAGDNLAGLSVPELHELRIAFKELRYTLDFLAPILGAETAVLLQSLDHIQDHLGALNDARIALELLEEVPGLAGEAARYRAVQVEELARLVGAFPPLWAQFDSPAWRRDLAASLAGL